MNFLHLAKRHEQDPVVAESHHLGLQTRKPRGADLANVAERNIRPDRFDHEPRDLNDLAHANDRGRGADPPTQVLHQRWENWRFVTHFNERATF